jgi:hypothetical protein
MSGDFVKVRTVHKQSSNIEAFFSELK